LNLVLNVFHSFTIHFIGFTIIKNITGIVRHAKYPIDAFVPKPPSILGILGKSHVINHPTQNKILVNTSIDTQKTIRQRAIENPALQIFFSK